MAKPEAIKGSRCPICPYAFPANETAMPIRASAINNPIEYAIIRTKVTLSNKDFKKKKKMNPAFPEPYALLFLHGQNEVVKRCRTKSHSWE